MIEGVTRKELHDRIRATVRAFEALIRPAPGETEKMFIARCTNIIAETNAPASFRDLYRIRSAAEHLHEPRLAPELGKYGDPFELATLTLRTERWARHTYQQILNDEALRVHFSSDERIDAFWKLP